MKSKNRQNRKPTKLKYEDRWKLYFSQLTDKKLLAAIQEETQLVKQDPNVKHHQEMLRFGLFEKERRKLK